MIAGLCHVGADVLSGPQAATGRPYNTHNIRSSCAVGRDDPARRLKFAFCPSRGPDFRRRTGDISPPGEVLSMDGKYPKILGSADPDPERTFRPCPKFVRRRHELGAAASSARYRSCRSNQVTPLFSHCAPRVPCLFGSIGGRPDGGDFPLSRGNVPQGQRG